MTKKDDSDNPSSKIEDVLGPKLLTNVGHEEPTAKVLKGKDIVLLYFSASWCPPCQSFTPILVDFFKTAAQSNGVQVVFVSSDKDLTSFHEYFAKMPWVAIPTDAESAKSKQSLAAALKIKGIPALIALDGKTGKYITNNARNEVLAAEKDAAKGKELIAAWKSKEAVSIQDAVFDEEQDAKSVLQKIIYFFAKNPLYIFGTLYLLKRLVKWIGGLGDYIKGEGEL